MAAAASSYPSSLIKLAFSLSSLFILSSSTHISISTHENSRSNQQLQSLYESWLLKHAKSYNSIHEKENRFQIFKDNLNFIDEHNSVDRPYKLGLTRFADLTNEEYRSIYSIGGQIEQGRMMMNNRKASNRYAVSDGDDDLPESVDWREKGAVVPVKNQGHCGNHKHTPSLFLLFIR